MSSFMDDDDTTKHEVANFDRKPQNGGASLRKSEKIEDMSFESHETLQELDSLPYTKFMEKFSRRSMYRILYYKYDYYTMKEFVKLFNKNVDNIMKFINTAIPSNTLYGLFRWKENYKSNGSIYPIICISEAKNKEDGFVFITGAGLYYISSIKVLIQTLAKACNTKLNNTNYRTIKYKGLDHDKSFIFIDKSYADTLKSFIKSL